ncbi:MULTISPECIES: amidohydrolase [unclassified Streptomyces]|uniref:amidohydrolase n=1 Tax=unclassified Streptomyces TaxID=2593676 RepID=UPI00225BA1C1|nr:MULTISPECIES: amidohydrolase [unclassified Streptomyces]MCX4405901.1 amidohydrolase [Streptomyces sp. NBC_01764]MCX5189576.1 amidohydrolase [Streptomyces sp. NBC_00268]
MHADIVFTGGTIRTGALGASVHQSLAVVDGRISALGAAALAARGPRTTVVDLVGGALLPAFGDSHVHPVMGGLGLHGVPVRDCASAEGIVEAVRHWAEAHPDAEWVSGDGFDPWLAPDGRFDARWLDAAVPDRPVVLRTTDHHTAWVNSEALRRAGYTANTPDPVGGEILRRDGTTEPLGTLREFGALSPVLALIPPASHEAQVAALREAAARFAAAGVTWVQDAWVEPHHADVWITAATTEPGLPVRADLAFILEPDGWRERIARFVADRDLVESAAPGLLTALTVKFFADGVIESGTAALLEPYTDCAHSHGIANWAPEELAEAVTAVDALGFRPHIHAIGDGGVRTALDVIEAAAQANGPRDRRPVIAHAQLIHPADLPRFAELGVIASLQPLWAQSDPLMTELTLPRIGPERGGRQYQIAALLASGAQVSFGSDWPVTAHEPLRGIATAVTRQTPDGTPDGGWLPEERIDIETALTAYSAGCAHQAFEEKEWGVLRPGMRADLVHLAADPVETAPAALAGLPVLGTWLAGRPTHLAAPSAHVPAGRR